MENANGMLPRPELKRRAKERFLANYRACAGVAFAVALVSVGLSLLTSLFQQPTEMAMLDPSRYLLAMLLLALISLISSTLTIEAYHFFLRVYRGEKMRVGEFFASITVDVGRKMGAALWMELFIALWALLAMLPGVIAMVIAGSVSMSAADGIVTVALCLMYAAVIVVVIKSLSYGMMYYIIRDCPGVRVRAAMKLSMRMMKGNKGKLFVLLLSFFGWILLMMSPVILVALAAPESVGALAVAAVITLVAVIVFLTPYLYAAQAGFYDELKRVSLAGGVIAGGELDAGDSRQA